MRHWKLVLASGKRFSSGLSRTLGLGEAGANQGLGSSGAIIKTLFNKDSTTVTYTFAGNEQSVPRTVSFSNLFLRDASRSEKSIDPFSGQKLFRTGQLLTTPNSTIPQEVEVSGDKQSLHIKWGDGDSYEYPLEFLNRFSGHELEDAISTKHAPILWDQAQLKHNIGQLLAADFTSYMNESDTSTLHQTLINMRKFGISFIADFPKKEPAALLKGVAQRIGPIRQTFYGEVFDVINKPSAENIAYTNRALSLHQDLLYLDHAPGWQILHALKNSSSGSESGMNYFVDAFNAARFVRDTDADAYEALTQVPINYHYNRNDNRYYNSRPLIVEHEVNAENLAFSNYASLIKEVNYSPMFQAPFDFGIWEKPKGHELSTPSGKMTQRLLFKDFLRGLALFEKFINLPENQFRFKLPENTCVIFDNRRLLHARTAFTGERWLRGCYLDNDAVKSRLSYLEEKQRGC
ncbi:LANO_0H18888g1_1 [Lachancea nothofagi CBS 11611]|uniref:LANO_0H18888g1_1 n=1 Tax=Lachancea nothofagi CBS 11611 TaxID=1266666 RepID=A0A1G4KN70_9SACH|nr:LANO_0H18888g1_1 [Lachancea nothofagi CBS 11611]